MGTFAVNEILFDIYLWTGLSIVAAAAAAAGAVVVALTLFMIIINEERLQFANTAKLSTFNPVFFFFCTMRLLAVRTSLLLF